VKREEFLLEESSLWKTAALHKNSAAQLCVFINSNYYN
jgi:hypothetical protein